MSARDAPPAPWATALEQASGLVQQHPQRAARLAARAERGAERAGDEGVAAGAMYLRAQVLAQAGELPAALELILRARRRWTAHGDALAALRTDLGRMHVLDDLGRHREAVDVGEALLRALEDLPPGASAGPDGHEREHQRAVLRGQAVKNLGVGYGLLGDHERALAAYERARGVFEEAGRPRDAAMAVANSGLELLALGRPDEARSAFESAIAVFDAAEDRVFGAQCRADAALALRHQGRIGEALRLLEEARGTLERLEVRTEQVRLHLATAETYLAVDLWEQARHAACEAQSLAREHAMLHDEARALFIAALAGAATGEPQPALAGLAQADRLCDQVGDAQLAARVALARVEILAAAGQRSAARSRLPEVLDRLQRGGWALATARARLLAVDLGEGPEDRLAAWRAAREALADVDLPELRYELELRGAELALSSGDQALAERRLWRAIAQVELATRSLPDHALLTSFRRRRGSAHRLLVRLLLERDEPASREAAALVADDLRARTLLDLLRLVAGTGPALDSAGSGGRLGDAFAELNETYLRQETAPAREREALRARGEVLERTVSNLRLAALDRSGIGRNGESGPSGAQSRSAAVVGPTLAFHVSDEDVVVFVHLPGGLESRTLRGALPQVHTLLDDLDDQWTRATLLTAHGAGPGTTLLGSARATLGRLHEVLVAPVSDLLEGLGPRLCIVPDSRLGAVPYALLHDGCRHLMDRWAVTLAPSLLAAAAPAVLVEPGAATTLVAVADERAPQVDRETAEVRRLRPDASVLSGPEATVRAFCEAAAGSALLHVACHGAHQPRNPLFSRLRLHDRWMASAEVVGLDLRGTLVVLSACEAGAHSRDGEPVGLAWAFLAAGARAVVVPQWRVEDAATAELMVALHRGLLAGMGVDEALRRAQQDIAATRPHPVTWGAFCVVQGPGEVLLAEAAEPALRVGQGACA